MPDQKEHAWTLAELADESGVSARTIRYYISRGLLDGPLMAGRGASYGAEHLERLLRILAMQAEGLMLEQIARKLGGGDSLPVPAPVGWNTYSITEDCQVSVRIDASPWRLKQIQEALRGFAAQVRKDKDHDAADSNGRTRFPTD